MVKPSTRPSIRPVEVNNEHRVPKDSPEDAVGDLAPPNPSMDMDDVCVRKRSPAAEDCNVPRDRVAASREL